MWIDTLFIVTMVLFVGFLGAQFIRRIRNQANEEDVLSESFERYRPEKYVASKASTKDDRAA